MLNIEVHMHQGTNVAKITPPSICKLSLSDIVSPIPRLFHLLSQTAWVQGLYLTRYTVFSG